MKNVESIGLHPQRLFHQQTHQQLAGRLKGFAHGGQGERQLTGDIGISNANDGNILRETPGMPDRIGLDLRRNGIGQRDQCGRTFFLWQSKRGLEGLSDIIGTADPAGIDLESAFRHTAQITGMAVFDVVVSMRDAEQADPGMSFSEQIMHDFRRNFGIVAVDCRESAVSVLICIDQIKGLFYGEFGGLFPGRLVQTHGNDFADAVFHNGPECTVQIILGKDFDSEFSFGGFQHDPGHDLVHRN